MPHHTITSSSSKSLIYCHLLPSPLSHHSLFRTSSLCLTWSWSSWQSGGHPGWRKDSQDRSCDSQSPPTLAPAAPCEPQNCTSRGPLSVHCSWNIQNNLSETRGRKAITHPTREIRFLSLSEMCSLDSSACSWQTSLGRQCPVMVASTCFLSPPPPPDPSLFTLPPLSLLSLQLQAIRSPPQLERMKRARTRKATRVLVSHSQPSSTIPWSPGPTAVLALSRSRSGNSSAPALLPWRAAAALARKSLQLPPSQPPHSLASKYGWEIETNAFDRTGEIQLIKLGKYISQTERNTEVAAAATQSSLTTPSLLSSLCQYCPGGYFQPINNRSAHGYQYNFVEWVWDIFWLIYKWLESRPGTKVKLRIFKTDTNVKEPIQSFTKAGMGWSSGGRGWTWSKFGNYHLKVDVWVFEDTVQ